MTAARRSTPPRRHLLTAEEFREEIRRRADEAGGQALLAAQIGISPQLLSNVVRGSRAPTPAVVKAMGLERVTLYRRIGDCGRTAGRADCSCGWPDVDCEITGWPDPARLGMPLQPDVEREHWLVPSDQGLDQTPFTVRWHPEADDAASGHWANQEASLEAFGQAHRYVGPALLPSEVRAEIISRIDEALAAAGERARTAYLALPRTIGPRVAGERIAAAVRRGEASDPA